MLPRSDAGTRDRLIEPFTQFRLCAHGLEDEDLTCLREVVLWKPECDCNAGGQIVGNPLLASSDAREERRVLAEPSAQFAKAHAPLEENGRERLPEGNLCPLSHRESC
jgi:hypothetical protein